MSVTSERPHPPLHPSPSRARSSLSSQSNSSQQFPQDRRLEVASAACTRGRLRGRTPLPSSPPRPASLAISLRVTESSLLRSPQKEEVGTEERGHRRALLRVCAPTESEGTGCATIHSVPQPPYNARKNSAQSALAALRGFLLPHPRAATPAAGVWGARAPGTSCVRPETGLQRSPPAPSPH